MNESANYLQEMTNAGIMLSCRDFPGWLTQREPDSEDVREVFLPLGVFRNKQWSSFQSSIVNLPKLRNVVIEEDPNVGGLYSRNDCAPVRSFLAAIPHLDCITIQGSGKMLDLLPPSLHPERIVSFHARGFILDASDVEFLSRLKNAISIAIENCIFPCDCVSPFGQFNNLHNLICSNSRNVEVDWDAILSNNPNLSDTSR